MSRLTTFTDWRIWLRGAFAAAIGGGAHGFTAMVIKPEDFNFDSGWASLWRFTAISAGLSLALYLKQSPVPPQTSNQAQDSPSS